MYKPVPFLLSNQGYGMLFHTTARITADLGQIIIRQPALTSMTTKSTSFYFAAIPKAFWPSTQPCPVAARVPPLWSYGLWMSRITYNSEEQVRDVADKLRQFEIPCDVIHIDTGWFEKDWCCDYEFSEQR